MTTPVRRFCWAVLSMIAIASAVVLSGCTLMAESECQSDDDCAQGEHCQTGGGVVVRDGLCVDPDSEFPPQCDDGQQSGAQTDVDCGGPYCRPCELDADCEEDTDCASDNCHLGSCIPFCTRQEARCDGYCADTENDSDNCGECGNVCGVDQTCDDGQCVCRHECCEDSHCGEHEYCEAVNCRPLSPFVYTASDDETVRKIDSAGDEVWVYDGHAGPVLDVAVDADGYVYSASVDTEVHKISPDGVRQWAFEDHDDPVRGVAVDAAGYVYTASDDQTVYKVRPDGAMEWRYEEFSSPIFSVEVGPEDFVYVHDNEGNVHKIAPGGDVSSTYDVADDVYSIGIGVDESIYVGLDGEIRGLDADAIPRWQFDAFDSAVLGVAVDLGGYAYSVSGDGLVKIDEGEPVWTRSVQSVPLDVAVDPQGNSYLARIDHILRKNDGDGHETWEFSGHSSPINAVAVDPGVSAAFPDEWD